MNEPELARQLTAANKWWRQPAGWEEDDRDLKALPRSFTYDPSPLTEISAPNLYVLRGPRRVGKSVELKRAASLLLADGVEPRRVIHCACDGLPPMTWRRAGAGAEHALAASVGA